MKIIITSIFILFTIFDLSSQNITPEQDAVIYNLSKNTAKKLSANIFTEFLIKKSGNYNINIIILPATDAMNNITTFGVFFSKSLTSTLQAELDSWVFKRYNYNIYSSIEDIKDNSLTNYTIKISYFFKNSSIVISEINLSTNIETSSLQSFEIEGNISKIKDLEKVAENTNFNNIFDINSNNNLLDSVLIFNSNNNIIPIQNNNCNLQKNTNYKFRFYLKPHTFLYVFYYEPHKSNFYFIYPSNSNNNRKLTYYIKDVRNISFNNVNFGKIKVIVSNEILKIDDIINDKNNGVSAEQAEIVYKEISKNTDNLSTFNLNINF